MSTPNAERNPWTWGHEYHVCYLSRTGTELRTDLLWTNWDKAVEWAALNVAPDYLAWIEVRAVSQWSVM